MFVVSERLASVLLVFCFAVCCVHCHEQAHHFAISSTGKPLVKRPPGGSFKVLLSVDGAGARGIVPAMTLIELERSIKQYLLDHPELLPAGASISTPNDFDINLVDYFDCMTALSSGSWTTLYLASRGGQGAARRVLEDPAIIEKYGVIPAGGAEGVRVLFREYVPVMFPFASLDPNGGIPFDRSNPQAPGVSSPVFGLEEVESSLELFLGNTTLADLDTSMLIPTVDLITGYTIYFVQNAFKNPPISTAAPLISRAGPRAPPGPGGKFSPDFQFDERKDYLLTDVGTAAAAFPTSRPAKPMSQVGSDITEYLLVDGIFPFESSAIPAAYFVSTESGVFDLQDVAVLSLGGGLPISDRSPLANAGIDTWLEGFTLSGYFVNTGIRALTSVMDFIYYSHPETKPYQYLRVQREAPVTTEDGIALANLSFEFFDDWEEIGRRLAEDHRSSIDAFVRDFIFA